MGLNDLFNRREPTEIKFEFIAKQISCGFDFTMVLSEEGEIYSSGNFSKNENLKVFNKIEMDIKFKKVDCGKNTIGLMDENGSFSTMDRDCDITEFANLVISDFSCGETHYVCVDDKGNLYTLGDRLKNLFFFIFFYFFLFFYFISFIL